MPKSLDFTHSHSVPAWVPRQSQSRHWRAGMRRARTLNSAMWDAVSYCGRLHQRASSQCLSLWWARIGPETHILFPISVLSITVKFERYGEALRARHVSFSSFPFLPLLSPITHPIYYPPLTLSLSSPHLLPITYPILLLVTLLLCKLHSMTCI